MEMENEGGEERRWAKLSVTKQPPSVLSTSSTAPVTIHRDVGVSPALRLKYPALRTRYGLEGKEGNRRALIYNTSNTSATSESPELTSSHVNRDTPETGYRP